MPTPDSSTTDTTSTTAAPAGTEAPNTPAAGTAPTAEAKTTPTGQDTTDTGTTTTKPDAITDPGAQQQADPAKAGEAKPDAKDAPQGAPEEYAAFAMPEGIELDKELGAELAAVAKENNLTQEQAQKVADLGIKQAQKLAKQVGDMHTAQVAQWADASKTDKEFGGDALEENLGIANKFMGTFSTPELKKMLDDTGLGNHPEVIRMMVRAGKAISQERFVTGGTSTAKGTRTAADIIYPNQKSTT